MFFELHESFPALEDLRYSYFVTRVHTRKTLLKWTKNVALFRSKVSSLFSNEPVARGIQGNFIFFEKNLLLAILQLKSEILHACFLSSTNSFVPKKLANLHVFSKVFFPRRTLSRLLFSLYYRLDIKIIENSRHLKLAFLLFSVLSFLISVVTLFELSLFIVNTQSLSEQLTQKVNWNRNASFHI